MKRNFGAELLSTFVMMCCGQGVCAQHLFSEASSCASTGKQRGESAASSYLAINLGWGAGVFFGIIIAGGVSGAHMNPAVTVTMAAFGRLQWSSVVYYITAQCLGAFGASATIYLEYHSALLDYGSKCCNGTTFLLPPQGQCNAASVWTTFPSEFESLGDGVLDQIIGTGLLLLGIFAIGDDTQRRPARAASPFAKAGAVAALVVTIGMSFGYNNGYSINPARDLLPRIFVALVGWGSPVFQVSSGWWWLCVPVLAPLVGGLLGAGLYQLCVGAHHSVSGAASGAAGAAGAGQRGVSPRPYVSPRHAV